jgi:hypothetical protein
MKNDFKQAAMHTVEMKDATAYVFYPAGNRAAMRFCAENVHFESSDSGLIGNERSEVDYETKSPEDCVYQATFMVSKMPQDGQPKVVVFVHEAQRFHFNSRAVAAELQAAKDRPQSLWQSVMNRVMPKRDMAPA